MTTSDAVPEPGPDLEARGDAAQVVDQKEDALDVAHAQEHAQDLPGPEFGEVGLDDRAVQPEVLSSTL